MTNDGTPKAATVRVHRVGQERRELVIMDHVLGEPSKLIEVAAGCDFQPPPGGHYPGLNAALPRAYMVGLVDGLRPLLQDVYGLRTVTPIQLSGYFGLATTPASDLRAIQKVPHYDFADPSTLALVHYLSGGNHGGTGFFRHELSGFETIDESRAERFKTCRQNEAERSDLTDHVGKTTPGYLLTASVEAVFNRLIIYRSNMLHSGLLGEGVLSDDVTKGRLTANVFIKPDQR